LDPATRSLATVTSFDFTHGANSYAGLIADAQGNFYGTTRTGGPDSVGTVFELPAGAGAVTTLATFAGPNGGNPQSPLVADAGGNLYGTASFGGLGNHGTVFEVSAGTHELSTLVAFNGTNGDYPLSGVIADSKGNLYGSTRNGGAGAAGVIYKVDAGTHAFSVVATFNGANGSVPEQRLLADADGNLYGTTFSGGTKNLGTVYEVPAGTNTIVTLATFDGANGASPEGSGGLIADAAGNLYGTTYAGGANNLGTVFKLTAGTRQLVTLATFDGTNGYGPLGGLAADGNGNLYGTTYYDMPNDRGTVFELSGTGFVVPEPASLSLVALAAFVIVSGRRRTRSGTYIRREACAR